MKRRILSLFCVLALCLGLLPSAAFAAGTDTGKAIQLVDSGISANIGGGQVDSLYFGTYQQSSDGNDGYNIDPIKWRVLENAGGHLFLLSDQNLDVFQYHTDWEEITWERSTMRSWLNGYGASENAGGDSGTDYTSDNFIGAAFSEKEQKAIAETTVVNDDNPNHNTEGGNNTTDKIFLLSIAEASNNSYFADDASRISTNTAYVVDGGKIGGDMFGAGKGDWWWLRSPGSGDHSAPGVAGNGDVDSAGVLVDKKDRAVRPAFNLNLNSVLFTSAAVGGKAGDGLNAVADYDGNEWKLTLLDEAHKNFDISNATTNSSGDTIAFSYSGAQTGEKEYISAVIIENGELAHYGRILQLDGTANGASGTASLTLPADVTLSDTVKLYVFNEQYNGDKMTDYASQLKEISPTVDTTAPTLSNGSATRDSETTATVKFTSDEAGSYYYVVNDSTAAPDSIDTSGEGSSCNANEETMITLNSLSGEYIHIVVKDAVNNVSDILTIQIPAYTFTVTVNVDPSNGGAASASPTTAAPNTEITLTATPKTGYHFKKWEVTEGTASIGNDDKFTMPASNVTVKAVFEAHSFTQENTDTEYLVSPATCTQAATYYYSCSCGAKGTETFTSGSPTSHSLTLMQKVDATCTTAGKEAYYTCQTCGKYFSDASGANEIENLDNYGNIPAKDHTWSEWTSNGNNEHTHTCSVCQATEKENCSGGEATCMSKAVCTICNSQYGELNSNNHNPASGWTQESGKHYHICQNGCGTHLNEVNCDGGTATCIRKATCSVCGHEYGDYGAHDLTVHNAKEPTCTETGNSQYWECSVCKQLFSDAQGTTSTSLQAVTIAATGHTAGETWQHDNGSTHWKLCVSCNAKVEETAHVYDNEQDIICNDCGYVKPTYAISASPGTLDFGSETEGYADAPAAQIVTITNIGNQSVTVNLPTSATYTITAGTEFESGTATLASDGTATFTVQPNTGLDVGSHDDTLNISGSNSTSASVKLSFEVLDTYTLTVNLNGGSGSTTGGVYPAGEEVNIDAGSRSNYRFTGWTTSNGGSFADASSASTTFTMPAADTTITANWQYDSPYIPPTKPDGPSTGTSDGWEDIREEIADADRGDTIAIDMNGETEVLAEIFEEVAGKDVTVEFELEDDISWTVNGQDVPEDTRFADLDLGVDMGTSGIDVDVINTVTGELGSVQITLAHGGEFGFALTLTAPLGKENAGYWANLYHYNEVGKTLDFETSAQVASDGTASLRMTHASQYAIVIDDKSHDLPFTDLGENQWYESAVRYAFTHDIMEGMSETKFSPNTSLTRAEAVQVLYNLEGQPTVSGNAAFPDLVEKWYKPAIAWAEQTGVVDGYEDGTFRPGQPVNRMEFAQMLYNYAKHKGYDLTAAGDLSTFPDSGSVADWAEAAMSWANGNELINGHDDGTIDAGGTAIRAQTASILMRFDQNLVKN